jgi:hypothetical protein
VSVAENAERCRTSVWNATSVPSATSSEVVVVAVVVVVVVVEAEVVVEVVAEAEAEAEVEASSACDIRSGSVAAQPCDDGDDKAPVPVAPFASSWMY